MMAVISGYKLKKLRDCPWPARLCDDPSKVSDFWQQHVVTSDWFEDEKECLVTLFLNTRRRVLGMNLVSIGTLDSINCHAREIYRPVLIAGASAIIIAHNHPSGDPSPSEGDIKVTRDLIRAGQILKVELLDSIVIGGASPERTQPYVSLRELGYFAGF